LNKNASYGGLTQEKAKKLQQMYGKNELNPDSRKTTWKIISGAIGEPIFLLLMSASAIYFLLGEAGEGMIMMAFVLGVVFLDVLQEYKTDKALNALNKLSQPMITVLRDGKSQWISSVDLVPGDICFVEEGFRIPADGYVLSSHDFCINESLLTGESGDVWKSPVQDINRINMPIKPMLTAMELEREDYCYAGTMVVQGNATILVDKIGVMTAYGEIGLGLVTAPDKITPLQTQMKNLTKTCTYIAVILFALVFIITFYNLNTGTLQHRLIQSFLSGIVLSLSMIPAEFPVILTVFLSMGSLRLLKKHGLIRKLHAVETLGSVSVICVDKTGTITKNQMEVVEKWSNKCDEQLLFEIAGLACDSPPHEAMDKAILNYCSTLGIDNEKLFEKTFIKGYPFTQECKTMAHVWRDHNEIVIAVKGSPEWILGQSNLTSSQRKHVEEIAWAMAKKGLRVIAVGKMKIESEELLPNALQECEFTFLGLLGLIDPPKEHLAENIRMCDQAGIRVIMITGDNGITAAAIADIIHFQGDGTIINGSQLAEMSDEKLQETVRKVNIFARVIPEQKLRIVKALQKNRALVAMTGDGVNDALALKNADIGIAMGLRGSEVTRESADLVLLDDNFSTIVESIQDGRRIYENIRKAIGYVFPFTYQ
jgi:Ca2+-transporting ATPase